jgi:hypothetical protein
MASINVASVNSSSSLSMSVGSLMAGSSWKGASLPAFSGVMLLAGFAPAIYKQALPTPHGLEAM